MPSTLTCALVDEDATVALAAALARQLRPGLSVHLSGPLGAGKTTLVRALLRALGEPGRVRSPTFTLIETYRVGGFELAHLDLYRFEHAEELVQAGFDEYLGGAIVTLIEWPERAQPLLPRPDLTIALSTVEVSSSSSPNDGSDGARHALLTGHSPRGEALVAALSTAATLRTLIIGPPAPAAGASR